MVDCTVFVGLDYHKDSVQVCVLDREGRELLNRRCRNDWRDIARRVVPLGRVRGVAIEACNGAASLAQEMVDQLGWSVSLAHPGYVHRIKQSPDKSDFSDSRLLADLMRVGYLPRVWLASPYIRELRALVRYRQQLVNERRNIKLRIRALLRNHRTRAPRRLTAWTRGWLTWVRYLAELGEQSRWVMDRHMEQLAYCDARIEQADQRLEEATADDAVVSRLCELAGVGAVTAWVLRAEIGRFDRFVTGKQLSRFCGLSPRNASSGERQADAGLIKAGSNLLRATLIQAAHRLRRYDARWVALSDQMVERGKSGSVIAAAVANRWVRWLHWKIGEMMPAA